MCNSITNINNLVHRCLEFFFFSLRGLLLIFIIFTFIYFYYPSPGLTESFKNNLSARLSTCPHGLASIAVCAVCSSLGNHLSTIAKCTHNWSQLNYDEKLVQTASCDIAGKGASDTLHHVVNQMGDIAYYCSSCHAISCVS